MILSDREIRAAIERQALKITPVPAPEHWSSTALDLTLDGEIRRWVPPSEEGFEGGSFNPGSRKFSFTKISEKYCETIKFDDTAGFVLEPSRITGDSTSGFCLTPASFILGWTIEKIRLPHSSRLAARVEGKSSLARLGIGVHMTAPTIHAGFGHKDDDPSHPGTQIQLETGVLQTVR